jgi:hypothetical protein
MKIQINWPNGLTTDLGTETTSDKTLLNVMRNVVVLSMTYDVIIDNGVITFVDKE